MRRILTFTLLLALAVAATMFGQQSSTGSISGSIIDPSGQVVPGARIKVIFEQDGSERSTTTSEVGDFGFLALQPGRYTVRVEATGFRPYEQKGNVLVAASRLALGTVQLEVGSVTESVVVTAQGAQVATTSSSKSAAIDSKQMELIAVKGRDPMSMFKTVPGVGLIADGDTLGNSFQSTVPAFQGRIGAQTVYTDGVNGGDSNGGNNFSGITSIDAVAEVNVQANSYTADQGFKGGAQINLVTKRGGQEFHGTGAWIKRHEQFNAQTYFNNATRTTKPRYRYSNLAGTIGGPVPFKMPILNPDGHRFNFFYSVDDTRLKNVQPLRFYTMPTAEERLGNYSNTRQPSGALIPVVDPLNKDAAGNPIQFPNNTIPSTRSNPIGVVFLNYFPAPNAVGAGYNYTSQETSIPHPRRAQLMRFDLRPTDKDTISIKYQNWFTKSTGWGISSGSTLWGVARQRYDFTSDQGKLEWVRIISPNLINEASIGVFYSTEIGPAENDLAYAGMQKAYDRFAALGDCVPPKSCTPNGTLKPGPLAGLRQIAPQNNPLGIIPKVVWGTLQNNSREAPSISYDNRFPLVGADTSMPIKDDITYTRGAHIFKAGIIRTAERTGQARSSNFGGQFNFANDNADPLNTRFGFANAFIGHLTDYTEDMGRPNLNRRQFTWAWYVQDQWKVNRRLTLDIGLRMYKWGPFLNGGGEASQFSFERFDPTWGGKPPVLFQPTGTTSARRALNPITGEILPAPYIGQIVPGTGYNCTKAITKTSPCQINGIVIQEDPTYSNKGVGFLDNLPIQFDPRFGIAWDPFGNAKTVIRVGGGAYHDATGGALFQGGPAWAFGQTIRYTDINSYINETGPAGVTNVTGAWRQGHKRPVTYQYNFGIQRDIGWNTILDIGYVGSNTHHETQSYDFNQIPAGARFLPQNRDFTVSQTAANPAALPDNFLRPIRGFGSMQIQGPATTSRYDSLQVSANRRFTQGIQISGAYTWAGGTSNGWFQNNPLPSSVNRSRNNTPQHTVVISYILDLPKGSRLKPGIVTRALLDNWQFIGLSQMANGLYSNITATYTDNFDFTGGGESCGSINVLSNPMLARDQRSVDKWFDTSAIGPLTGRGDIGNNCNNAKIKLPGFNSHDMSLSKTFPLKNEERFFTFRLETFNVFNHTQFLDIDTTAQFGAPNAAGVRTQTDTNFGKVTSTRDARKVVMGLKFTF